MHRILLNGLRRINFLLLLILLTQACHKEETPPEAYITLENKEGYQYRDTTIAGDHMILFVMITAKKGKTDLEEFGNIMTINGHVINSDTSKLSGQDREGFQKKYYYGSIPGTEKGKFVWEFFVIDSNSKKTSTKLNIDFK